MQQPRRQAAHLQRYDRAGQGGGTQIIRTGQRHLPSPGSVLGAEWPADAHVQEPAAADQELLRTPAGRHVQTSGLKTAAVYMFACDFLLLSVSRVYVRVCVTVCETTRGLSPQGEYLEEKKVEENYEKAEAEPRSLCFVQILLTQK